MDDPFLDEIRRMHGLREWARAMTALSD